MTDQALYLANDLFGGLIKTDHPKRVTICRGRHDVKLDLLTFISTNPASQEEIDWFIEGSVVGFTYKIDGVRHIAETVLVTEVRYKLFNNISDKEAQNCGYQSVEHVFEYIQRYHPDLAWTDEMTFVFFELQCDLLREEEETSHVGACSACTDELFRAAVRVTEETIRLTEPPRHDGTKCVLIPDRIVARLKRAVMLANIHQKIGNHKRLAED